MPYCSRCGVELDPGVESCPLCNTPIQKLDDEVEIPTKKYPDEQIIEPSKPQLTPKEKRRRAWETIGVSLLIPFLIVVFTNLIIDTNITWAKYPMIALMLAWLLCTFPLVFPKKPVVMILGIAMSLLVFLILIDYFDNWEFNWFYQLALPIIALVTGVSSLVVIASSLMKSKGLTIPAFILYGVGIINLGLDLIIMSAKHGKITVTWSLFVLVPTFIIATFLLYIHFRFARNADLKEKFKRKFRI
ncbi:MAG: DUF6320 domain-containing protein [Candidatus Heimdallarchaeaceae archaeon]